MKPLLEIPGISLEAAGGSHTAREIAQQPSVWPVIEERTALSGTRAFLAPLLVGDTRVVLTGAGTSACVGECLAPSLTRRGIRAAAVPTTDLVGAPNRWLTPGAPTLLVSFARSGNSPESVATLALADQLIPGCHHLIITCNRAGALYRRGQGDPRSHVILLPDETHDRGFAMTSSFSGMMLAAALAFGLFDAGRATSLAVWARQILADVPRLDALARAEFDRVMYLGGHEFKGLAREAALKMLELTDGRVVAAADTPLGVRHGPKTFIDQRTLVVMFKSNDRHARRYEDDLLRELRTDALASRILALTASGVPDSAAAPADVGDDFRLTGASSAAEIELCFPYAVFAQSLAFLKSLALGLRPDSPNAKGVVNRVVRGVSIYDWSI